MERTQRTLWSEPTRCVYFEQSGPRLVVAYAPADGGKRTRFDRWHCVWGGYVVVRLALLNRCRRCEEF